VAPGSARDLLASAKALLPLAVAPYSRFRVAAALEDGAGEVHPGVNVESASFGLTICAERNALFGALARGIRDFRRIAVVSEQASAVMPCGACRQVLFEYAPELVIVNEGADGRAEEVRIADLLPRPFARPGGGPAR
jgi:homotetrameric cytidine deaminase